MEGMKRVLDMIKDNVPEEKKPLVDELLVHVQQVMSNGGMKSMKSKPEYKFVAPFNSEVVEWQYDNWSPNNGDVLIASYPKTGTTWLREIARNIYYFGDEKLMNVSKLMEVPFMSYLEAGSDVKFDIVDSLPMKKRVWGTHLTTETLNIEKLTKSGLKIIYVMRNPKDMIVSMKKFFESMPWLNTPELQPMFPKDWNEFVDVVASGKMPMQMKYGEWYPHHIRSWMKLKGQPNFHFVYYEKMKKDPQAEISRLAKFLEVSLTEEQISQIVSATSFDAMKKASAAFSNSKSGVQMFRKGGVGNWKSHFTVAQSELVDVKLKEELDGVDVEFIYSL